MRPPHVLERKQLIQADILEAFRFFEDPRNLELITPPWLHFEVVSSSHSQVQRGTEIAYRLRWQILPMSWRSRIAEYEPGVMFSDEMLEGPYRSWYHEHLFEEVEDGVEITDVVTYRLPFGPLGRLVHSVLIRAQLEAIFDFRQEVIKSSLRPLPNALGAQPTPGLPALS
mgnify:CR=1 FL=1